MACLIKAVTKYMELVLNRKDEAGETRKHRDRGLAKAERTQSAFLAPCFSSQHFLLLNLETQPHQALLDKQPGKTLVHGHKKSMCFSHCLS